MVSDKKIMSEDLNFIFSTNIDFTKLKTNDLKILHRLFTDEDLFRKFVVSKFVDDRLTQATSNIRNLLQESVLKLLDRNRDDDE